MTHLWKFKFLAIHSSQSKTILASILLSGAPMAPDRMAALLEGRPAARPTVATHSCTRLIASALRPYLLWMEAQD